MSAAPDEFSSLLAQIGAPGWRSLYLRAYALTGQPSDACDLVQEAFARALEQPPKEVCLEKLFGWLGVTLRNSFVDQKRRTRRYPHVPLADDLPAPVGEAEPEARCWRTVDETDVQLGLGQLDPRLREVYELHAHQGLPLKAIAARLGIPASTAGTRLHRARRRLKLALAETAPRGPGFAEPKATPRRSRAQPPDHIRPKRAA